VSTGCNQYFKVQFSLVFQPQWGNHGPQPNQIGPVLFGSGAPKDQFQLVLTTIFTVNKIYYKTNYITLRAGACSGGVANRKKKKKRLEKKRNNPTVSCLL
jgi:hypothetical protein